jgi:hypothetical protein
MIERQMVGRWQHESIVEHRYEGCGLFLRARRVALRAELPGQ